MYCIIKTRGKKQRMTIHHKVLGFESRKVESHESAEMPKVHKIKPFPFTFLTGFVYCQRGQQFCQESKFQFLGATLKADRFGELDTFLFRTTPQFAILCGIHMTRDGLLPVYQYRQYQSRQLKKVADMLILRYSVSAGNINVSAEVNIGIHIGILAKMWYRPIPTHDFLLTAQNRKVSGVPNTLMSLLCNGCPS